MLKYIYALPEQITDWSKPVNTGKGSAARFIVNAAALLVLATAWKLVLPIFQNSAQPELEIAGTSILIAASGFGIAAMLFLWMSIDARRDLKLLAALDPALCALFTMLKPSDGVDRWHGYDVTQQEFHIWKALYFEEHGIDGVLASARNFKLPDSEKIMSPITIDEAERYQRLLREALAAA